MAIELSGYRGKKIEADVIANRPDHGNAGRYFLALDTGVLYKDSGTSWASVETGVLGLATLDAHHADHEAGGSDIVDVTGLNGGDVDVVATSNVLGGIPVIHYVAVPSGANADINVTLTEKTRVADVWLVLKGAGTAGSAVTVKNGATAITNAIDVSGGGDKAMFRASTIDDAQHEVAAAGTLRVTKASTGGDFPGAEVYVLGFKVA